MDDDIRVTLVVDGIKYGARFGTASDPEDVGAAVQRTLEWLYWGDDEKLTKLEDTE